MGQTAAKVEMSTSPVLGYLREVMFNYLLTSGRMVQMMEAEIVDKCPVPAGRVLKFVR